MWKLEPNKVVCMILGLTDHLIWTSKKTPLIEKAVQKGNNPCPIRTRIHHLLSKQQRPTSNRPKKLHVYLGNEGGFVTQSKTGGYCIPICNSHANTWYFCWHDIFITTLKKICHQYNYTVTRLVHWPTELANKINDNIHTCDVLIRSQNHTFYLQYEANICQKAWLIQQQTPKDILQLIKENPKDKTSTLYLLSHEPKDTLYLNEAGIDFEPLSWKPNTWDFIHR